MTSPSLEKKYHTQDMFRVTCPPKNKFMQLKNYFHDCEIPVLPSSQSTQTFLETQTDSYFS